MARPEILHDCRHYLGEKPCRFGRLCEGCPNYAPWGPAVCIVKLGAMGDALRTTPLARAIKKRWPAARLTWVTDEAGFPLLRGSPSVDELFPLDFRASLLLEPRRFDYLYCLDKAPEALAFSARLSARTRKGFVMGPLGEVRAADEDADFPLLLGLSDDLKFRRNDKTYQEIVFGACGFPYDGEEYELFLSEEDRRWAEERLADLGAPPGRRRIGLNTGCGAVFRTKRWTREGFLRLAALLDEGLGARVILLGGPGEREFNEGLRKELGETAVVDVGHDNPVKRFAALVSHLDAVVSGDTLAMHLSVALGVPVVALFGATCPQEVDLYGKGRKIFAGIDCAPCYKGECPEMTCMETIKAEVVFEAVRGILGKL